MAKPKNKSKKIEIAWSEQARQMFFLEACGLDYPFKGGGPRPPRARVIAYGGAAGGGKSDALLVACIIAGLTYPGINCGYFRREYPDLEGPGGAILRSHELMSGWATYNGTLRRWVLPNGSLLQFCHAKDEKDVYGYRSQQFDVIAIDEATQFTRFMYRYLLTRNRATKPKIVPMMLLASNPGDIGHVWFAGEFVNCGPYEQVHSVEVETGEFESHLFIPAKLTDNDVLTKRDPGYLATLKAQPEIIRRQLLDGDWSAFAGQYYKEWRRDIHVIEYPHIEIPEWWKRFRSLDYGLDMTACYWWAVDLVGRCYIYRELYQPDLNLTKAAEKILSMTPKEEKIIYTVASPDLWNRRQERGESGQEIMHGAGLTDLQRADHARIPGWRALREYLTPYEDEFGKKTAKLLVFSCCTNLIRTLPALVHDEHEPENVSDKVEDHGPESIRYGIRSRPYKSKEEKLVIPKGISEREEARVRMNLEFAAKLKAEQRKKYANVW